jgi:hypothetical protein
LGSVAGAFGAWGHYVDGCTVQLTCPAHLQVCSAHASSRINTEKSVGHKVTLNSRLRAISPSGNVFWFRDVSCANTDWCEAEDMVYIRGGQTASVQCNGVRESGPKDNRAHVACSLDLRNEY